MTGAVNPVLAQSGRWRSGAALSLRLAEMGFDIVAQLLDLDAGFLQRGPALGQFAADECQPFMQRAEVAIPCQAREATCLH